MLHHVDLSYAFPRYGGFSSRAAGVLALEARRFRSFRAVNHSPVARSESSVNLFLS